MPTSTKSPYSLQSDYNHTCSVQGSTSCIGDVDRSTHYTSYESFVTDKASNVLSFKFRM